MDGQAERGSTSQNTEQTSEIQTGESDHTSDPYLCSTNGRSHLDLRHFGITKCPRCQEGIDRPTDSRFQNETDPHVPIQEDIHEEDAGIRFLSQIGNNIENIRMFTERLSAEMDLEGLKQGDFQDANIEKDGDLQKHSDSPSEGFQKFVTQRLEYVDTQSMLICAQTWKGSFDLDHARQELMGPEHDQTIALTTITLKTDVHDRYDSRYRQLTPEGLLKNPDVGISQIDKAIKITSRPFISVLKQIIRYYPGVPYGATSLTLRQPFALIAHHVKELVAHQSTFCSEDAVDILDAPASPSATPNPKIPQKCSEIAHKHIKVLLEYLGFTVPNGAFQEELDRYERAPPMCTFTMLWLLYKPGTTVYYRSGDCTEAFVIKSVQRAQDAERKNSFRSSLRLSRLDVADYNEHEEPYVLHLWQLRYDGRRVRRGNQIVTVGPFDGERKISELKVVPVDLLDRQDGGNLHNELVESGKKWYALLRSCQQCHYKGPTRDYPSEHLDTRVVIDMRSSTHSIATKGQQSNRRDVRLNNENSENEEEKPWVEDYYEDSANCLCDSCEGLRPHPPLNFPWTDYDMIDPNTQESLKLPEGCPDQDHRYLLCTRSIPGFVLSTRSWARLNPIYCREPTINTTAINSLVMPDERKRLIRAIVQKYVDPEFTPEKPHAHWGADFIKNKGEGQIFLLHGGPGIGKTFWFKLAETWGAVMLLDEADVWLERRQISDLKRNTMVAVFLRCIEYYKGILFLTSNRVGTFDDAFISRIHVVIKYDDLGERERSQIWKQFFQKLENERKDIFVDSAAKDYVLEDSKMRRMEWNGREIRNAFQTAVSLAEYRFYFEGGKETSKKVVLDKIDFEQVCKMSVDFKSYLRSLHHGDSESDRAMRQGTR